MDDDRLRSKLRAIEAPVPPTPEFVEALHDLLAARLGFADESAAAPGSPAMERVVGTTVVARRRRPDRLTLVIAAAMTLLLAGAAIGLVGSTAPRPAGPSLLSTVRSAGVVTIAVRPDTPQGAAPGSAFDGFDLDVARAVAARLGVRDQIVVLTIDEMLARSGSGWQIALPSRAIAQPGLPGSIVTSPYYAWPVYVVTEDSASAGGDIAMLADATFCVVTGSAGESWLTGSAGNTGLVEHVPPPHAGGVLHEVGDAACLADLDAGRAQAVVTNSLLVSDIAVRQGVRTVGGPVAVETSADPRRWRCRERWPDARRDRPGADGPAGRRHAHGLRQGSLRWGGPEQSRAMIPASM